MTTSMFDDFVLRAKDIVDAAGKKSNEIYEMSKYKYECIKLNGEIKNLYEQLGSSVYAMVKGGYDNNDLVESLTEEIDEQLDLLKEVNLKISNLKNAVTCPVCGAKNCMDSVYCSKCGSKIKEEFQGDFSSETEHNSSDEEF